MLILASSLNKAPIICGNKGAVATVDFALFDSKKLSFLGVVCEKSVSKFFNGSKGILYEDLISIEPHSIYINHEKKISLLKKSNPLFKELNMKPLIGKKAKNLKNQTLGKITDIVFDSESGLIVKIYLSSWFEELILPSDSIVKVKKEFVTIDQDFDNRIIKEAQA